jgi:hypothetical protein
MTELLLTKPLPGTATFTPQPKICGDNNSLFRVKAGPGSSMSGQYLMPIVAFPDWTDLNSYFTPDVTQAMAFCIDSQNRLLYDSKTLNGNGASRINAAFLNTDVTSEQMYYNTIDIVNGCGVGSCYFIKYHVDQANGNALVADNGDVSTAKMCSFTNYANGINYPTYFLSSASDSMLNSLYPLIYCKFPSIMLIYDNSFLREGTTCCRVFMSHLWLLVMFPPLYICI